MKRIIGLVGLGALLVLLLFGCMMGATTIEQRIQQLAADLSLGAGSARSGTYVNFHPEQTLDVSNGVLQGSDPGTGNYFWDTPFPQTDPASTYTIEVVDSTDETNVHVTIDAPGTAFLGPKDAWLSMATYNLFDYRIVSLTLDLDGDHLPGPGELIIQ